ncbi:FAD-dependent oxidoreductase [Patescibacteria group bacterium]
MEDYHQEEQLPQPPEPRSNKKKWLIVLVIVLILGGVSYILASTGLFKGALYVDESLREKKLISESSQIDKEIEQVEKVREKEHEKEVIDCDVIVAGAGTGGVAAAIASAREGAETCLIEETNWLGGMLTAAGVSAIDGRPDSVSGIFYEIIQKTEDYYTKLGKQHEIHNCSVSYLCFEPHVGDIVLKEIAAKEKNLKIYYNSEINKVYREGDKVVGVSFLQGNKSFIVNADVTIDATEYGDLLFLANIDYDLGIDFNSQESLAQQADECIQPLTYVAILQEQASPAIIEKPPNYDREKYRCIIKGPLCPESPSLFDMDRLMSYGRMPNNKLMINIPSHSFGNDFHATSPNLENYSREDILEEAKDYSRGFIYFIQTELGLQNWALAEEFGTDDKFAKMPYVRESRRIKGVKRLREYDVVKGDGDQRADLVEDAIAIGDYPIDLHFCRLGIGDIFKPIAPYQIPYFITVPEKVDGFLVADKNVSVSHIVNGTTRLQPVTMSVGQAVGIAAAMASKQGVEPRNIDISELQEKLIQNGSNLFFFTDLPTQHWAYTHVARLAIRGLVSGYPDFTFKPDDPVNESDFLKIFRVTLIIKDQDASILENLNISDDSGKSVVRADVIHHLYGLLEITGKLESTTNLAVNFGDIQAGTDLHRKIQVLLSMGIVDGSNANFRPYDNLTRAEAIVFLGRSLEVLFAD